MFCNVVNALDQLYHYPSTHVRKIAAITNAKFETFWSISGAWPASICMSAYYTEAIGSNLSMFCKNTSFSHGEGECYA